MADDVCQWRITGFYGFIATTERYKSWDLIQSLSTASSLPWLILWDFNEVVLASEKFGGRLRSSSQIQGFRDVVRHCNLLDLSFEGDSFTWANSITKCRLDCCLVSSNWRLMFNYSKVIHLALAGGLFTSGLHRMV